MNIVCEKKVPIIMNDKVKVPSDLMKSMDIEKSTSLYNNSQQIVN